VPLLVGRIVPQGVVSAALLLLGFVRLPARWPWDQHVGRPDWHLRVWGGVRDRDAKIGTMAFWLGHVPCAAGRIRLCKGSPSHGRAGKGRVTGVWGVVGSVLTCGCRLWPWLVRVRLPRPWLEVPGPGEADLVRVGGGALGCEASCGAPARRAISGRRARQCVTERAARSAAAVASRTAASFSSRLREE
jgi:hypothetical protein